MSTQRVRALARQIQHAVESVQESVDLEAIGRAFEAGDGDLAESAVSWDDWEAAVGEALTTSTLEEAVDAEDEEEARLR